MNPTGLLLCAATLVPGQVPEQLDFPLRNGLENQQRLGLFGPEAAARAQADDKGLRFTLPADRGDFGPVGVEPRCRLRGDFDITLAYELLDVPNPGPPRGAGVLLVLKFDSRTVSTAIATRLYKQQGPTFGANLIRLKPGGAELFDGLTFEPAKELTGKLRVSRTGKKLAFHVADGDAGFRPLAAREVAADEVTSVQAQCSSGGEPFAVDVRLIGLTVRADQIVRQAPADAAPAEEERAVTGSAALWVALVVVLLLAAGFAAYVVVRGRRAEPDPRTVKGSRA